MSIFYALLLIAVLATAWLLTVAGMPGNWLMVGATALYAWLVPTDASASIGWGVVLASAILAGLGELLEMAALALLGSMAGGLAGMAVGVPIPLVGPLVGAVLFASLGALLGAAIGERWKGRELVQSWQVGKAAFWGRLLGNRQLDSRFNPRID